MKIIMFSMTPLFANKSMGGAQKQLKKVALALAENGHQVTVLCTRRVPDSVEPFSWHERAQVVPIFRFKQPFPEPYETPPYHLAHAIQTIGDYLHGADAFYSHDGGLIFPYVYTHAPSVVSLRSVLFGETLQSGFLFQGDALILPSPHTVSVWEHTAGRFFPELKQRIRMIPNGLDFNVYQPQGDFALAERLGLDPVKYDYVLYPHRPEDAKGIRQTILTVEQLVKAYGQTQVRVLVPKWIDSTLAPHVARYYHSLEADIQERGLREHFIFHDWINDDEMPAFYRLGAVTFALGNYVETFGNTPYESLACGTLPVVARVGAYRGLLPEALLVDYGDIATASQQAYNILASHQRTPESLMAWLHRHFAQPDMVAQYEQVILGAKQSPAMPYVWRGITPQTRFQLAPWCYVTGDGRIFHDFKGDYMREDRLLNHVQTGINFELEDTMWLDEGYVVPIFDEIGAV